MVELTDWIGIAIGVEAYGVGKTFDFCKTVELFNDEYLFELKCIILGLKDNPSFPWWLSKARNFVFISYLSSQC